MKSSRERSKNDVDRAVEESMKKAKNEKERNLRCYHIAVQYFKVGDYESARRYVCMYLSARENSPLAHKLLGLALEGLGQKEKAISELKRSIELDNNQPDLVLKICSLMGEKDVHLDVEKARYWCERGDVIFPHNPAIFRLKERLLTSQNDGVPNPVFLEALINSELKASPNDVRVQIQCLKLYVDTGRTQLAYNNVIELEHKETFRFDLSWYEYISVFFQTYYEEFTSIAKGNWEFFTNWISALERLVSLILSETSASESRTLADCSNALLRLDQTLRQAHLIACSTTRLFEEFLKHMSAQLCLHLATFSFKKAKKEQSNWKEAAKNAQPLLLLCLVGPPDLDALFTVSLNDKQKKLLKHWNESGLYRICQAANVLLSLAKESSQKFMEKIIHFCTPNWRGRLYQKILGICDNKDIESKSHFLQHTGYNTLPSQMISTSQLRSPSYLKTCETIHPGSLHHVVWIGLQMMRHSSPRIPLMLPPPEFHTYGFSELHYTVHNLGAVGLESLNRLDVDSFLYATVLCAGAQLDDQIKSGFYALDRPVTLPADITAQLCTSEQAKWWSAAYKFCKGQAGNNWGDLRLVLSRGIEVVRTVGNHGLDVLLMVQLARTFTERAVNCSKAGKGVPGYSEVAALEARAYLYWKAAIPFLERLEQKQALRLSLTNSLFKFPGRHIEPLEIRVLLEEGRFFVATQLMKDEEYEQAIEAFKPLRDPYASFHSAAIYKRLAQAELNNCPSAEVTSEMRSKHIILLTKAREALHLTRERIHDDRQHPLHHVIGSEIANVESSLGRIELDGAPVDDRNEGVALSEPSYSPPGSIISHGESAGGDFNIASSTYQEVNGRHTVHYPGNVVSSTPKSRNAARNLNLSPPQQKPGLTAGDVEKMLKTHERAILSKIEDLTRKLIDDVGNLTNEAVRQSHAELKTQLDGVSVAVDELRRDMTKLRPEDLYMLGDDDDYTEDVLGFQTAYQPPPPTQTAPPAHAVSPVIAPFYSAPAPVSRGAQGTATVTYGGPPQPHQYFPTQFQPSPQPPIQPHQLGFYTQGALPFSEGQQLPDFLRVGQALSKGHPNVVITTSDTLPTGPPPVQPTLSVTIPAKHRMSTTVIQQPQQKITDAPHEFQISMPPSAHIPDPQKSPVAIAAEQDDLESDEGGPEIEHDPFPDFKPIIPLPDEIVVKTGEEGEKILFENRSKLFRFVDKEWKERGVGMLKILLDSSTGKARLVMRREQVHKICANHYLTADMKLTPMVDTDRAWVWLAHDFAEEKLVIEKLCAKFKTSDDAARFKDAFDSAKVLVSNTNEMQKSKKAQPPPVLQKEQPSLNQKTQSQPTNRVEVGGFTFTSEPVFRPPQDPTNEQEKKESKVGSTTTASPFASFSFGLSQNSTMQRSAFPISTSSFVTPAAESVSNIFKSPTNSALGFQKTDSPSLISPNNSGVLKPPSVSQSFVINTLPSSEGKNLFQPAASIFSPAASQEKDSQSSINLDILKTPIFATPTGPSLILNQLSNNNTSPVVPATLSTVLSSNSTATAQSKHVLFKDNLESGEKSASGSKPGLAHNVSPKSILKETLSSEPVSSTNTASKSKHVLFHETTKDVVEHEKTGEEKVTLRRPHLPIQKLLSPNEDSLFNKPSLLDFTTLAKSASENSNQGFKKSVDFKGFEGAGSSVFKSAVPVTKKADNEDGAEDPNDDNNDFVPSAEFTPIIPLPELINVETGEEGQTVMYEQRAKLLRYDNETKQWKERGVGKMKILHDPKTGSVRLLMRREQVYKVCCNHRITPDLQLKLSFNSDKAWTWYAQDYSEGEVKNEFFALRFKTSDQALEFKDAVDKAKEIISRPQDLNLSTSDVSNVELSTASESNVTASSDTDELNFNVWKCSNCLFPNAEVDEECRACHSSKCSNVPLAKLSRFKRQEDTWECPHCYVYNSINSMKCISCYSPKATIIEEIPTTTPSLSEQFKPKPGSWECSSCLVRNNADVKLCAACGTLKEGETAPTATTGTTSSSLSGLFSSGDVFSFSNVDISKTGFTFGMPKQNAEVSSATFSFGVTPSSNNNSGQLKKDDLAETAPEPAATTGFTFGIPTSSNSSENKTDSYTTFTKPIFGSVGDAVTKSTSPATFTFGAQSGQLPTAFVFKGPDSVGQNEADEKIGFNFSGVRRPRTLSGSSASGSAGIHPDSGPDSEGEVNEDNEDEEGDSIFFQPVIPLPDKVPVTTGEENEAVLYSHRAKLFRFVDGEWKERGIGDVKILKHHENNRIRLLMRRDTILKICLNHFLTSELSFQPKDDKTWLWCAIDYSEGEFCQEKFAIRFKTPDIAKDFKDAIDAAQAELSTGSNNQSSVSQTAVSTPSATTVNTDQKDSPAMRSFSFTLPSASPSMSSSQGPGFSLAAQFGSNNSSSTSTAKSLFGGDSPKASDAHTEVDIQGDVEVVYERSVSDDLREKARELQLPSNFYSYLYAPSCPGCAGCDPEDRISNNNASTSTINTITKSPNMITSPSVSSNSSSISSATASVNKNENNEDQRPTETEINVPNLEISSDENKPSDPSSSQKAEDKLSFLFKDSISFSDLASSKSTGFKTAPDNFQWAGANSAVFGKLLKTTSNEQQQRDKGDSSGGEDEESGEVAANQNEPHFEPVIPLPPLVALSTGEEEEERVFCERAKLFVHSSATKEWKERGVGEMKILHHPVKLTYRLLMRRDQVHKTVCNHLITPELKLMPLASSDQALCWTAMNMADEFTKPDLERLAVKFKNKDITNTFKDKVAECIAHIHEIKGAQNQNVTAQPNVQLNTSANEDTNDDGDDDDEDDDEVDPEEDSDEVDEDDDDDDDEYEDDWQIIFKKDVTVSVRDNAKAHWESVGPGSLALMSNTTNSSIGQIKIYHPSNELMSYTAIDKNSNVEVKNRIAVWTADDSALDPPANRQIMATFRDEGDAHVFLLSFQEILNYAKYDAEYTDDVYQ